MPWKSGKLLVWNAASPDTFAPYSALASTEAGMVAVQAEERIVTLVGIETSCIISPKLRSLFMSWVTVWSRLYTGDANSLNYSLQ